MNAGDTLQIPLPGTSLDSHLWMVISDPGKDEKCLIVNFTSWRSDKDQACVVDTGDHPYISKKTCVNFKESKLVKVADLNAMVNAGKIKKNTPLSAALLNRIRQSVSESRMPIDHAQFLIDQGLCDDL